MISTTSCSPTTMTLTASVLVRAAGLKGNLNNVANNNANRWWAIA